MRPILPLVVLLAWPLAEIAGFVVVGRALGLWWTLSLVILTGLLGAYLLRRQGLHLLKKLSEDSQRGEIPPGAAVDGAMIVVAGILLLLPGFLTDVIGLALFIPFVRRAIWSSIGKRFVVVRTAGGGGFRRPSPGSTNPGARPNPGNSGTTRVLDLEDGEFHRDGDANPSSPWAKDGDEKP